MDLTPYLDGLRRDLTAVAAAGGPEVARTADVLAGSLEPSARLYLLEALSDAAAEITTRLARGSVEVRLRGREAQFVVAEPEPLAPSAPPPAAQPPSPTPGPTTAPGQQAGTDGDLARITLRLPEALKEAVEQAAAAEGVSVNAWLVRAVAQMVGAPTAPRFPAGGRMGRRVTGFAQA